MLESLGIDDDAARVYRATLAAQSRTLDELVALTQLPSRRVRVIVADLERLGLLARPAADADRFIASPPSVALRPLLLERERGLTRAHEALVELSDLYRRGADERGPADVVDVVRGADAVRQRVLQLQAAATSEVRFLVKSDVVLLTSEENIEEDRALERGIRYRVIVESGVLDRPGFLDAAREAAGYGEEVRVLPTLPTRMLIADDSLALLPMHSADATRVDGALILHPSGLLDLVSAIFEEYWTNATDFLAPEGGSRADGVDRDVIKLLLLGLTDAAVGAQLGVSERTVQRRLAELMAGAGVTTRMQLGAEAVRRGWV